MNEPLRPEAIDRTLASMMTPLDAAPDFEARLRARLAREASAPDPAAVTRAREQALRERLAAEAALRSSLHRSVATVALSALAAAIPAWLLAPVIGRALLDVLGAVGPIGIASVSVAALILILWRGFAQEPGTIPPIAAYGGARFR